ncbi:TPA: hypothetical protein ACW7QV_003336 [Citrobacter braakii]
MNLTNEQIQALSAILRAMAFNYEAGHRWDHLDKDAVTKAADVIESLLAKTDTDKALIAEMGTVNELFLRAKALMYQSGGSPIENALNPIDAWLYDAESAELEARTLTVKLPPNVDASNVPFAAHTWNAYRMEAIKALESACAAAGITLVVGGEDAQG